MHVSIMKMDTTEKAAFARPANSTRYPASKKGRNKNPVMTAKNSAVYTAENDSRPRTLSHAIAKLAAAASIPKASVAFSTVDEPPACWANMRDTPPA